MDCENNFKMLFWWMVDWFLPRGWFVKGFFWIMLCLVGSLGSAGGMDGEKRLQDMAASSLGLRM